MYDFVAKLGHALFACNRLQTANICCECDFSALRCAIPPQSIANCKRNCVPILRTFGILCIAIAMGRRLLRLVREIDVISMNLISDVIA